MFYITIRAHEGLMSPSRARNKLWCRGLCLDAAKVAAVTSVDLDDFAFVDEEGHADFGACLHAGGLEGVGGGVALEARLGPSDGQFHLHGDVGIEDGLGGGVGDDLDVLTFLHEVDAVDLVLGDGNLLEGLVVHEDVVLAFHVEELIAATLNAHILEFLADVEAALQHVAAHHVLESGAHDGVTLARLHVEEVDAEIELAVHTDAGALLDVL